MHLLIKFLHSAQYLGDKKCNNIMCLFTREEAWLSNSESEGSSMANSAFKVEEFCGKEIIL